MSARDDDRSERPTTDAVDTTTTQREVDTSSTKIDASGAAERDAIMLSAAAQIERETDLLVQLAGERAFLDMDLDDPRNHRFLEWLARDLRERQTPAEQVELGLRADAFARRMVARMRARRTRPLSTIAGAPTRRPALAQGGGLEVARTAAAHRAAPLLDFAVAAGVGRELWDEPCEQWIDLPDDVPDGSYVGLTVAGDSMHPLLHAGDVLLVQLGADIIEDTIVVARHPDDGYVVKRVGDVTHDEVELTSLNPEFGPVHIPRDASLIVGTVMMTWCNHGTMSRQARS